MVKTHGSSNLDPGSLLFTETESLGSRLGFSLQKKRNVIFRILNFTLYNIFNKFHALSDLAPAKHELHWNIWYTNE